ncbi:hypothetical protein H0H92_005615 [Tricholoma furcatifolium]|nr:hypothetical protein H0H92_005615 [Tricholoma furcatifolium]
MDDTPPLPTPATRKRPPHLPTIPPLILDNTNLTQGMQPILTTAVTGEDVEITQNRPSNDTTVQAQPHTRNALQPTTPAQEGGAPAIPLNLPPNITLPKYTPIPPMGFPDHLFSDKFEDADLIVTKTIRMTIASDTTLGNIITSCLMTPISAKNFARNVYAVSHTEEVPKGRGESRSAPLRRVTHWNVYFRNPPSLQSDEFFIFAKQFRCTIFCTPDRGRGRALEGPLRYHCVLCKGADHNPPRCPYLSIPGWHGTATQFQCADSSLEWVPGNDRDDDKDRANSNKNNHATEAEEEAIADFYTTLTTPPHVLPPLS